MCVVVCVRPFLRGSPMAGFTALLLGGIGSAMNKGGNPKDRNQSHIENNTQNIEKQLQAMSKTKCKPLSIIDTGMVPLFEQKSTTFAASLVIMTTGLSETVTHPTIGNQNINNTNFILKCCIAVWGSYRGTSVC